MDTPSHRFIQPDTQSDDFNLWAAFIYARDFLGLPGHEEQRQAAAEFERIHAQGFGAPVMPPPVAQPALAFPRHAASSSSLIPTGPPLPQLQLRQQRVPLLAPLSQAPDAPFLATSRSAHCAPPSYIVAEIVARMAAGRPDDQPRNRYPVAHALGSHYTTP